MLENIWVIPFITFVSFWLILFFGKRLPFKGSEVGLLAVGATLVLSVVAGAQWIDRPFDYTEEKAHASTEAGHAEEEGGHAEEAEDEHALAGGATIELAAAEEEPAGGEHAEEGGAEAGHGDDDRERGGR